MIKVLKAFEIAISEIARRLEETKTQKKQDFNDSFENISEGISEINIKCETNVKVTLSESTIKASLQISRSIGNITFSHFIEGKILFINVGIIGAYSNGCLYVECPQNINIEINNSSGDVRLDGLFCPKISVRNGSGDIRLKNVTFERAFLNTMSGNILVANLTTDCKIDVKTMSGTINTHEVKQIDVGNPYLNCETSSGDIIIKNKK